MNFKSHTVKNFYSFIVIIFFMILAAGSAQVNKIHCGAFSTTPSGEDLTGDNYVLMNDGTKVFGDRVTWKAGLIVKDQIKIGDQAFKIKETQGYFANGIYYTQLGSTYAKRIIHGKINVYYTENLVTSTSTDGQGRMRTSNRTVCTHYAQRGDNGAIVPIADQGDIKEFVKDCPASLAMIDKKDKEIRRSIKKDHFYMNQIFVTYNNGCQ
jgi:hypothetical protein